MQRGKLFWVMIVGFAMVPLGFCGLVYLGPYMGDVFMSSLVDSGFREIAWSPDSAQLHFTANLSGGSMTIRQLYVMDADGDNLRRLTDRESTANSPTWSPDGNQIAVLLGRDRETAIYLIDVKTGEARRVIQVPGGTSFMKWSPDGERLAFWVRNEAAVYVVDTSGDNLQKIYEAPQDSSITQLDWSPTGEHLAFVIDLQLYVIESNGDNLRQLTQAEIVNRLLTWSADGERIAFWMEDGEYAVNLAGGEPERVGDPIAQQVGVVSPDGSLRALLGCEEYLNLDIPPCFPRKLLVVRQTDPPEVIASIQQSDLVELRGWTAAAAVASMLGIFGGPSLALPWLIRRKNALAKLLAGVIIGGYGLLICTVVFVMVAG